VIFLTYGNGTCNMEYFQHFTLGEIIRIVMNFNQAARMQQKMIVTFICVMKHVNLF